MSGKEIVRSPEEMNQLLEAAGKVIPKALAAAVTRRLFPSEWGEIGGLYITTGPDPERSDRHEEIEPSEDAEPIEAHPDDLDYREIQRIVFGWPHPLHDFAFMLTAVQPTEKNPDYAVTIFDLVPDSPVLDWALLTEFGEVSKKLTASRKHLHWVVAEPELGQSDLRVEYLEWHVTTARDRLKETGWKIGRGGKLCRSISDGRPGTFLNQSIRELAEYLRPRFATRWPNDAAQKSPQRLQKQIHTLLSPIFGDVTLGGIRGLLDKL